MTMNRRNFITGSAFVGLGTLLLPKGIKAAPKKLGNSQSYRPASSVKDGVQYEITLDGNGIENFSTATSFDKTFKLYLFKNVNYVTQSTESISYTIKKVTPVSGKTKTWVVKADINKDTLKSDSMVDKDFKKTISFEIMFYDYVKIYDKKDKLFETLKWIDTNKSTGSDDYEGCFLTTACVENKGLADDCDELTTLRLLRDNFMKTTAEGNELINAYQTLGPQIVTAINSFENKKEIYDFMYEHMISPSVALVKQGNMNDAVSFYKESVKHLKEAYL